MAINRREIVELKHFIPYTKHASCLAELPLSYLTYLSWRPYVYAFSDKSGIP